jgi:D-inositol-3-phosphate glycosyltransferase
MNPVFQIRDRAREHGYGEPLTNVGETNAASKVAVTILTGGIDRPYTFGLTMELISKGAILEVVGSDSLDFAEFHDKPEMSFLNLQGDQRPDVSSIRKVLRLFMYYAKLIHYAAIAKPRIFHILWNNKFEHFDRTLLMLYYRVLRKKVVLTVHNVNAAKRDSNDTRFNRLTLRIQYRLADHIFVHSETMKLELSEQFGVQKDRVSVIPFGINNAVPTTRISRGEARQRLGLDDNKKTILFFGRITPYKGLEYLIDAFDELVQRQDEYRLVIAGRPENDCRSYWSAIQKRMQDTVKSGRIMLRAEHIPDDETELFFKAADVLVLPYRYVYQSGVLFLAYSFGLPVLATDVGSLKEEIVEGNTGFVFSLEDSDDLAATIERYFASDLFANLSDRRQEIKDFANRQHSWDLVGKITMNIYSKLLQHVRSSTPRCDDVSGSLVGRDRS